MSDGSGGGGWVNVFDPPVDLLDRYVVLATGVSGSTEGDETIYFMGGVCSAAVAAVQTADRSGTRTYPIDPARPFFLVGIHDSGRVRVLDAKGQVLLERRGEPLDLELGE